MTAISAGGGQTCTLADGRVLCWGSNYFGQLGNGATVDSSTPVEAQGLSGATAIGAGNDHACALAGGRVLCWGQNWSGQLGDGTTDDSSSTPVAVPGLSGVTAISAGDTHTCAVADGLVLCWGSNLSGQLGDGTTVDPEACLSEASSTGCWSSSPVEVQGLSGPTAISAGGDHTCALAGGRVLCWGSNYFGQLGDGTTVASSTPVEAQRLSGATAISAGLSHTCAMADGRVLCWGSNLMGQLGDGTTVDLLACSWLNTPPPPASCWSSSPVEVQGLADATAVSAGTGHTCALAGGRVLCWGANSKGQLGNGATVDSSTPVEVQGL